MSNIAMTPLRDPFAPFVGQLDSLFNSPLTSFGGGFPRRARAAWTPNREWNLPVNVFETDDGIGIEAWLPGFSEDEIAVTVEDGQLRVHAEHASAEASGDGSGEQRQYRRREVERTMLTRQFKLDPSYDAARISARLSNGVLELSLPISEAAQPQQIAINVAADSDEVDEASAASAG